MYIYIYIYIYIERERDAYIYIYIYTQRNVSLLRQQTSLDTRVQFSPFQFAKFEIEGLKSHIRYPNTSSYVLDHIESIICYQENDTCKNSMPRGLEGNSNNELLKTDRISLVSWRAAERIRAERIRRIHYMGCGVHWHPAKIGQPLVQSDGCYHTWLVGRLRVGCTVCHAYRIVEVCSKHVQLCIMPRLVSNNNSSRATHFIRCRPNMCSYVSSLPSFLPPSTDLSLRNSGHGDPSC